jgi:alkylation response protein AidB-like acyl-CoA dehydrogenase
VAINFDFDPVEQAMADSVAAFCRDRVDAELLRAAADEFPLPLWKNMAELGILELACPDSGGSASALCAVSEQLGRAAFPGPLAACVLGAAVLDEKERAGIIAGDELVSLAEPPLLPWGPLATHFLVVKDGVVLRADTPTDMQTSSTLGGEPWGRAAIEGNAALADSDRGLGLYLLTLAAWQAAAGRRLVELAAEHASTRQQFGRAIASFQAVAHPLADSVIRLDASAALARSAAFALDTGASDAMVALLRARASADRAAVAAAQTCHQVFGALGVSLEGPVFNYSRRMLQAASLPPNPGWTMRRLAEAAGLPPTSLANATG